MLRQRLTPALLASLGLIFFGCRHNSLKPGAERVSTKNIDFVFGTQAQINKHCRKGNEKYGGTWDNGDPIKPNDGSRARCCVKYRPDRKRQFTVFVSRYEANCIVHEFCHIEEFLSGKPNHKNCHDFGVGEDKSKKRLKHDE